LRAATACFDHYARGCATAAFLLTHDDLRDDDQAIRYGRESCESGDGWGCYITGWVERNHKHDFSAAVKYLRTGCDLGQSAGCSQLAELLERHAMAPNAATYFGRGCELGSADSCWEAARLVATEAHGEKAGEYRAQACVLDPKNYCKRK
jgi:TPR repeat protein